MKFDSVKENAVLLPQSLKLKMNGSKSSDTFCFHYMHKKQRRNITAYQMKIIYLSQANEKVARLAKTSSVNNIDEILINK